VIQFYVPLRFHKAVKLIPQAQRGRCLTSRLPYENRHERTCLIHPKAQ